jgi:two-component SAPR family response regulator
MKVIIVDDERNAGENLQTKLKQVQNITKVEIFQSPMAALDYVKEHAVDIAFLDIEMPEMAGIEMARRLKGIHPRINIIFVTAYDRYALDAFRVKASDYLLKPVTVEGIQNALYNMRNPIAPSNERVWIQTFGNFEVFVNGKPLQISRTKAKELLAYLVDKRGTPVRPAEIAVVLWEDREYNRSMQKQTQTVISQMMKILKDAGIEEIIIKSWNNISIDKNKINCDFYRFLEGDMAAVNEYAGEYMNEYSWAEMTAGLLAYRK